MPQPDASSPSAMSSAMSSATRDRGPATRRANVSCTRKSSCTGRTRECGRPGLSTRSPTSVSPRTVTRHPTGARLAGQTRAARDDTRSNAIAQPRGDPWMARHAARSLGPRGASLGDGRRGGSRRPLRRRAGETGPRVRTCGPLPPSTAAKRRLARDRGCGIIGGLATCRTTRCMGVAGWFAWVRGEDDARGTRTSDRGGTDGVGPARRHRRRRLPS